LQNILKTVILNKNNSSGAVGMYFVGKINREIYSCITQDIVTDEVVITDKQIQHIFGRHPEAYAEIIKCLQEAVENPDYILRDKHDASGLLIKTLQTKESHIQIVLRICTSKDVPGYKNSIISCWKISDSRLRNYLRNKDILYKK